jgi:N-acetylmuramoyl-L-alanine amidase
VFVSTTRNKFLVLVARALSSVALLLVASPTPIWAQAEPKTSIEIARTQPPSKSGVEIARTPSPSVAGPAAARKAEVAKPRPAVARIKLTASPASTQMLIDLTAPVTVKTSTMSLPDRVIVDLPEVDFKVDPALGQRGEGLVKAFRYGLFGPKHSRMVLDTDGPVSIARSDVTPAQGGRPAQLIIDLVRADPGAMPALPVPAVAATPDSVSPLDDEAAGPSPQQKHRPVIVIDAGHGGIDPGTVGAGGVLEKHIVLAVAQKLRSALTEKARYTVVMTRSKDIYISLDQRLRISRREGADLFLSIHADAVPEENLAQAVRGGSIYTLSEHASDEQARRLAERENGADVLAGLESASTSGSGEVRNILIDLLRRETDDFSAQVRGLLAGELRKHISLAREPQRSASFKVLKQAHSPSVLIELGYMSNPEDQKMMRSAEWQQRVAGAIAAAIDTYFATKTVGLPYR